LYLAFQELNITIQSNSTQKKEELFDLLRKKRLMMFSLQKHLKRKEILIFIKKEVLILGKKDSGR